MAIEYQCSVCNRAFTSDPRALADQRVPEKCPECAEILGSKRGSGRDQGLSQIMHGPCAGCGYPTQYFDLPDGTQTRQCADCARAYSSSSY